MSDRDDDREREIPPIQPTEIQLDSKDWQRIAGETDKLIREALIMLTVNKAVLREARRHIADTQTDTPTPVPTDTATSAKEV